MKKLKKLFAALAVSTVLITAVSVNASAATLNDGYATDLDVVSQSDSSAQVEAIIENANAYNAEGLNYSVSVSDNAEISGDTSKSDVSINSEADDKLNFTVTLKETSPTEETTEATASTEATKATDATSSTTPVTTAAASTQSTTKAADNTTVKTGSNDVLPCLAIIGGIAFVGLMIFSFKRKDKRMLSLVLCGTITLSAFAVAIQPISASALESSEKLTVTDTLTLDLNGEQVDVTLTFEYPKEYEVEDNSLAEITAINDGVAPDAYFNNNSKLSFLSGKFTDYKVINWQTAFSSTKAVAGLLGIDTADVTSDFLKQQTTLNGDTYYTFVQTYGNEVVYDSYYIVGADSDGNVISVSSSIDTTVGVSDGTEKLMTYEEAKQAVLQIYQNEGLTENDITFFDDAEHNIEFHTFINSDNSRVEYQYAWKLYFKNTSSDYYHQIYIDAVNGKFYEVNDRIALPTEDNPGFNNDNFFEEETTMMTFTDYFGNEVQLPVATDVDENGNQIYYFLDTERRIICENYAKSIETGNEYPYIFENASDVNPIYVSIFYNLRRIYDFYEENFGITGIDNRGTPILIYLNYKDNNGEDVDNAMYAQTSNGYHVFQYGNTKVSVALDVAGHEFTHGFKNAIAVYDINANLTGSLNESYGDIMGNLIEMMLDPEHADTETWEISETSQANRSMGDPNKYQQPAFVGDAYYEMTSDYPNSYANDSGYIHQNDSVINNICYKMNKELGLSYQDLFTIWGNSLYTYIPVSSYEDILGYVRHSMRRNGFNNDTIGSVQTLFENANIYSANNFSWENTEVSGDNVKIEFIATDTLDDYYWTPNTAVVFENGYFNTSCGSYINNQLGIDVVKKDIFNQKHSYFIYFYQDSSTAISSDKLEDGKNCTIEESDNLIKITFSLQELIKTAN